MDWAAFTACSVARRPAKGVLFREPLNPTDPPLPQVRVFPSVSVIVMIVLLNVALICTCPTDKVRFTFFDPPRREDRTF